jgi:hypothetical protein
LIIEIKNKRMHFDEYEESCGLMVNDIKWLIELAKKIEPLEEYIGQLEHEKQLLYGRLNQLRDLLNKKII